MGVSMRKCYMVLLAREEWNWLIQDTGVHAFTLIIFHNVLGFLLSSCLSLINIVGLFGVGGKTYAVNH